jgi:hypothetical protein
VVVVASCVVSAADMLVVLDSGVVVLSGEDVIEVSSGVKEVVGAPKRGTWGVLALATTLL